MKRKWSSSTVVVCYTLDGQLVKIYRSAKDASRCRNLYPRTIDRCIRGDIKVVKNLQWKRFEVGEVPDTIPPLHIETKSLTTKPVGKLDENDEIIEVYPSIKNAAKNNGLDPHSLRDTLNKKYGYVGKTKFRYLTDNEINKYNLKKGRIIDTKIKPVIQYSLDGKYIKTYPSTRAATIAMGREPKNRGIYQCLTGQYDTAFGYVWKYKDEPNVERPRKHRVYICTLNANNVTFLSYCNIYAVSS